MGNSTRPHSLFWLALGSIAAGAAAAAFAGDGQPAVALQSNWVYRGSVGLAVAVIVYIALIMIWLAWHGQVPRRIELPGGGAFEAAGESLDSAASEIEAAQSATQERIGELEDAFVELDDRLIETEKRIEGRDDRPDAS